MGVDEGNLLLLVEGVERYILTSSSQSVEIKIELEGATRQISST